MCARVEGAKNNEIPLHQPRTPLLRPSGSAGKCVGTPCPPAAAAAKKWDQQGRIGGWRSETCRRLRRSTRRRARRPHIANRAITFRPPGALGATSWSSATRWPAECAACRPLPAIGLLRRRCAAPALNAAPPTLNAAPPLPPLPPCRRRLHHYQAQNTHHPQQSSVTEFVKRLEGSLFVSAGSQARRNSCCRPLSCRCTPPRRRLTPRTQCTPMRRRRSMEISLL